MTRSISLRILLALAVIIIPLWCALLLSSPRLFGFDFFPLYFAALRIREGLSPYGVQATAALQEVWKAPFGAAGVAYPLPLIQLIVPLTVLPFGLATSLWISLGTVLALRAVQLQEDWQQHALIPFLFLPFHRCVLLGQATLVWFGLAVALIFAIRERKPRLVAILAILLLLKPQNGLVFAVLGLIWLVRSAPRALLWAGSLSLTLLGVAFALQPTWLTEWIAQVGLYQQAVTPPSLLPLGLFVVLACMRLPWWAIAASAQVVLFPLSDVYSMLPLLLCWIAIGGPLGMLGAAISWVWSLMGLPNTLNVLWIMMLWPLMIAAVWRSWIAPYLQQHSKH